MFLNTQLHSSHQFKTQVTKSQVCLIHCYNVKNQPMHLFLNAHEHMSWYPKRPFHSLGTCSYSTGTHCRNLLQSFVTLSRVTYFILRAHTEFLSLLFYRSSSVSFPLNVMVHFITNLTQSPSVSCYGAALINLFQCD